MNYDEVVEVLDLRTLHHDGFTYMHELCFCAADNKTAFKPSSCACSVIDDVSLDYTHSQSLPELLCDAAILHYNFLGAIIISLCSS